MTKQEDQQAQRVIVTYDGKAGNTKYCMDDFRKITNSIHGSQSALIRKILDDLIDVALESGKPEVLLGYILSGQKKFYEVKELADKLKGV